MAPQFYRITHEVSYQVSSVIHEFQHSRIQLKDIFNKRIEAGGNKPVEIDVLSWLSRAALEMIAQGGMGHSFNTLVDSNESHPYPKAAGELTYVVTCSPLYYRLILTSDLSSTLAKLPPILVQLFHPLTHLSSPALRRFLTKSVSPNLSR